MDKATSWSIADSQRIAIATLLESLAPDEWDTSSLCDGWTVRDVAVGEVAGRVPGVRHASTVRPQLSRCQDSRRIR